MSGMRLPLTLSTAGHASLLALLVLLVAEPSPPDPLVKGGIEVVLGQSVSQPQAGPAPEAPTQAADPSKIAALPPPQIAETEPVVAAAEPIATLVPEIPPPEETEPVPPPPRKPVIRPPPKTVAHQPQPRAIASVPTPAPNRLPQAPQVASASTQPLTGQSTAAAAMPASVPGPDVTANYRAMISAWFEAHKHYPDSARQRGEEGSVGLRFRVDRFGRVLDYRVLESTGYADLDAGIDQMMRGAQLPPFPAGMTASEIEVSVKLRFKLTQ